MTKFVKNLQTIEISKVILAVIFERSLTGEGAHGHHNMMIKKRKTSVCSTSDLTENTKSVVMKFHTRKTAKCVTIRIISLNGPAKSIWKYVF